MGNSLFDMFMPTMLDNILAAIVGVVAHGLCIRLCHDGQCFAVNVQPLEITQTLIH